MWSSIFRQPHFWGLKLFNDYNLPLSQKWFLTFCRSQRDCISINRFIIRQNDHMCQEVFFFFRLHSFPLLCLFSPPFFLALNSSKCFFVSLALWYMSVSQQDSLPVSRHPHRHHYTRPLSPPQWLDQRMACQGPQSHCAAKEFTTVKSLMGFSSELFHWATATLSLPCCKGFKLCWDGSYPDTGTKAWEQNRGKALYLKEGGERGRGGVWEVGRSVLC